MKLDEVLDKMRAGVPMALLAIDGEFAAAELEVVASPKDEVEPRPFQVFSQRDPEWRGDQLGPDPDGGTLGNLGCAVSVAAMIAASAGLETDPRQLNAWLTEHDGYFAGSQDGPRNLLSWQAVANRWPVLQWNGKRVWRAVPAQMDKVREALRWGPVIAEVDFDNTDRDVDQHFVVLLEEQGDDEMLIADPWDGEKVGLVERYYNPEWQAPQGKVARVITGVRLLRARM